LATFHFFPKDHVRSTSLGASAWNDNGQEQFVRDPKAIYRSDFFPGLGWMLNK
jgi:alpha-1,3-mannosyl-glycoprotein beta-1,2-N-acetylglucosaminyltransferase